MCKLLEQSFPLPRDLCLKKCEAFERSCSKWLCLPAYSHIHLVLADVGLFCRTIRNVVALDIWCNVWQLLQMALCSLFWFKYIWCFGFKKLHWRLVEQWITGGVAVFFSGLRRLPFILCMLSLLTYELASRMVSSCRVMVTPTFFSFVWTNLTRVPRRWKSFYPWSLPAFLFPLCSLCKWVVCFSLWF